MAEQNSSIESQRVEFALRDMLPADYEAVMALWNSVPGVRANESREEFGRILTRNPGCCPVAVVQQQMVGAVLGCHDGRRGYLYHLAVAETYRKLGIARALVNRCLERLELAGIGRCTIFLIRDNEEGRAFWKSCGWRERIDLVAFAKDLNDLPH
jgi:ribosomal protein S18 acetylase RimI-like enzyme